MGGAEAWWWKIAGQWSSENGETMAVEEEDEEEAEEKGNPDDAAAEKSGTEAVGGPWICHSHDPTPKFLISVALSCIENFQWSYYFTANSQKIKGRKKKKDNT